MRYKIREKIFSFGDNFTVKDEDDRDIFKVKGKVFAIGDKLRLYDMQEKEISYIEQKVLRLLPEYNIYMNGMSVAKVKKQISFFKAKFNIESSFGDYSVEGDVFSHEFNVLRNGTVVARVSKKWFSLSDTYSVDVSDSENQGFMVSLVIVIDQVIHDDENKN
ncbi:LURP-one-related/scramblase family protein [Clostridium sp. DL1XJH146]